ncbi:MAG: DUF4380 domain-containing protein [Planctomycetota bacterium]
MRSPRFLSPLPLMQKENVCRLVIAAVAASASAGLGTLSGCQANRYIEGDRQVLEHMQTRIAYDADIDRLVYYGPRRGPNMLHTKDLDQAPSPTGDYTFYGGHYTWIAPQSGWVDADGNLQAWPPDPAMDRGPTLVTRLTDRLIEVEGPTTLLGLRHMKTYELLPYGILSIVHRLQNENAVTTSGSIWSNTAVPPGAVIAVPKPAEGDLRFDRDDEIAQPLWDAITEEVGNWVIIRTDDEAAAAAAEFGGEVKIFITAPTQIAVGHDGYWLVRRGYPWDETNSLAVVNEAPIEVYLNFGLELFEAELLGPHVDIAPGEATEFQEAWFLMDLQQGDPREIDATFAAFRDWLGMEPADNAAVEEPSAGQTEDDATTNMQPPRDVAPDAPSADLLEQEQEQEQEQGEQPEMIEPADDDLLDGSINDDDDDDDAGDGNAAPAIDPSQFIEDRPSSGSGGSGGSGG